MATKTNEQALEACIEKALTGTCREQLKLEGLGVAEANEQYRGGHLYWLGEPGDFDREFAVDRRHFWNFLETTQAEELAKIKDKPNWQRLILERLNRKIQKEGVIKVLKSGLKIDDANLTLLYSQPYNVINPEVAKRFEQNIFSITRQLYYSQGDPLKSIDFVLFINGIAVVTVELKNAWTGQTTYHAMKQYRKDRDPNEPLLQFGRCLVHFAVDTDDVYMTTRLDGEKTNFLPFNKGYNHGKGNPTNRAGHKTSYLWQEIFTRQGLTTIIEHFAKLVGEKESDPIKKKALIFPRYHQLEVVRELLGDVREKGVGQTYLIQHSAGSGKSNSITWTAYQLIELYTKEGDHPVFDSVSGHRPSSAR
jgi:type I restriction enzyme, R subunit